MKQTIATLGAKIRVTPYDNISFCLSESEFGYLDDLSPFDFCVNGILEEDGVSFGVFGPIANNRYRGLICSLLLRNIPSGI